MKKNLYRKTRRKINKTMNNHENKRFPDWGGDPRKDILSINDWLEKQNAKLDAEETKAFGAPMRDCLFVFPGKNDGSGRLIPRDEKCAEAYLMAKNLNMDVHLSEFVSQPYAFKKGKYEAIRAKMFSDIFAPDEFKK